MKIGIISSSYYQNDIIKNDYTFCTRIQPFFNNSDKYELWANGKKYDALLFHDVLWIPMMEIFDGPKYLDITNIDWFNFNNLEYFSSFDVITSANKELVEFLKQIFPNKTIEYIPYSIDVNKISGIEEIATSPQSVLWFGDIQDVYESVDPFLNTIHETGLSLTVMTSEKTHINNIKFQSILFNQETLYDEIRNHDLLLNPPLRKGIFKYKSVFNKSLDSWCLGTPVVETVYDMVLFNDVEISNKKVKEMQQIIKNEYNIFDNIKKFDKLFLK